jgi:hypothetical protein
MRAYQGSTEPHLLCQRTCHHIGADASGLLLELVPKESRAAAFVHMDLPGGGRPDARHAGGHAGHLATIELLFAQRTAADF